MGLAATEQENDFTAKLKKRVREYCISPETPL